MRRLASSLGGAVAALSLSLGAAAAGSFDSCIAGLKSAAIKAGVAQSVAEEALGKVAYDEKAVRFSKSQPEYRTPIWDYMAFLVDDQRIADGRSMMKKHAATLKAVERKYGVDRYVVAAVWGVESDFGQFKGDFHVPHALATLACAGGRRAGYFRGELFAILGLVSDGHVHLSDLTGSWAGAFGQTQFMPTTYRRLAVDFDGNGRRDLVNSVPDALASTANFLKKAGWRDGQPWGFEVIVPPGYKGPSGRKNRAPLSNWASRGLKRADGKTLSGGTQAGLLLPAGASGPGFLVTTNFDAVYSYNAAESYGLAISYLADRLRGGDALATSWPTDDPGLSRAERLQLQKLLNANGFNVGEADGRVGQATRDGIKRAEAKLGLPVTGRPGQKIYRALGGR